MPADWLRAVVDRPFLISLLSLCGTGQGCYIQTEHVRVTCNKFFHFSVSRISSLNAVVSALADPKKKEGHIPYRDSKLTRILQVGLILLHLF